jgi:uncharacterized protein (TIGR03067 family)
MRSRNDKSGRALEQTRSAENQTMKRRLVLAALVVIGAVMAADDMPPDDVQKIVGTWNLTGFEIDGKSIGDSVRAVGMKVTFNKDQTVTFTGKGAPDKDGPLTGNFKLDGKSNPKTIDTTVQKTTELGIYQLGAGQEKDELWICMARAGGERPKTFQTGEGDGTRLFKFKREGKAPDKDKGGEKDKDKDKIKEK